MRVRTLLIAILLPACGAGAGEHVSAQTADRPFKVAEVADLTAPWAMTFLPDGRMLVTEKEGQLLLLGADGKSRMVVAGTPGVSSAGQGALMDVVLHPGFASNRQVYFSFSEADAAGLKGVALARGTLVDGAAPRLDKVEVLFRGIPYVTGDGHYSGRIAFAPDGHLFFTVGERQKMAPAQDPGGTLGKVLRLKDDGTPAPGNPLAGKGFHPAVWSYGHRNLLGIAFDKTGNLWEIEMGPQGGDEINLVLPGRNYGWPTVSNGSHYGGGEIPDHKPGDGFEPPSVWWNPVISPGNMIVYSGAMFPEWQGDILVAGLSGKALARVELNGTTARKAEHWDMGTRIRDVEQGPDGAIWLLEDGGRGSAGKLMKLTR